MTSENSKEHTTMKGNDILMISTSVTSESALNYLSSLKVNHVVLYIKDSINQSFFRLNDIEDV